MVASGTAALGTLVGGLILYAVTREASDLRYRIEDGEKRLLGGVRRASQTITIRNEGDRTARNVTLTIEPTGYRILQLIRTGDEGVVVKAGGEGFDFAELSRERVVPGGWWAAHLDWEDEWAPHKRVRVASDDGVAREASLLPSVPTLLLFGLVVAIAAGLTVYLVRKEEERETKVEGRLAEIEQHLRKLSSAQAPRQGGEVRGEG